MALPPHLHRYPALPEMYDGRRMLSVPIPIRFAGWESDTLRLQQAGWQLSAMERSPMDVLQPTMQLALYHSDLQIRAMTRPIAVDYLAMHRAAHSVLEAIRRTGLDIKAFGTDLVLNVHHEGPLDFRAIDAMPMVTKVDIENLSDLKIFADAQLVRTEEIIVMPDNVPELMAHILKLQDPKQVEIRERIRKDRLVAKLDFDDVRPRQRFHAQILSLT